MLDSKSSVTGRRVSGRETPLLRFVHLAPEAARRSIERGGLRVSAAEPHSGVHCMPVVADFWTTYQWMRELRRGQRLVAVHFHVPDDETVWVGRFGTEHRATSAAQSHDWVSENPMGAQVILPRPVVVGEIRRVTAMTQRVGWTGTPEAHDVHACVCPACVQPGDPDLMRRVRGAYLKSIQALRDAESYEAAACALGSMEVALERAKGRLSPKKILSLASSPSALVRATLAGLLGHFSWTEIQSTLMRLLEDNDAGVVENAVVSLWDLKKTTETVRLLWVLPRALAYFAQSLLEIEPDETLQRAILARLAHHPDQMVRRTGAKAGQAIFPDSI